MTESKTYCGSCLCAEVRFEIVGGFENFYLCHCEYCRKDSGSAHAANLFSRSAKVHWLAGESNITTYTLPGTRHSKSFCSRCGSALPQQQISGSLLVVPAGSLDSDIDFRPDAHLFTASRAHWDSELESIPQCPELPD